MTKHCTKCLQDKDLTDFQKCTSAPDGLQYRCRDCQAEGSKLSRAKRDHKEEQAVKQAWYKKNQEKVLAHYATKRDQRRETTRLWDEAHPEQKQRNNRISRLRRYGLTEDQYLDLKTKQDNRCAICGVVPDSTNGPTHDGFHIDHCHVSGRVRGLLCGGCNTGIGMLKDSETILHSAIEYLRLHTA